jgi:hypothetical protein
VTGGVVEWSDDRYRPDVASVTVSTARAGETTPAGAA